MHYEKMMKYGKPYFNLAFGDHDDVNGLIYDDVVTNNGDMRKVLKTVISTMKTFFTERPGELIHIEGSDPIRNKFYQKIVRDYEETISEDFKVMGYKADSLEPFKREMDYAFIVVDIQEKSKNDLSDQKQ